MTMDGNWGRKKQKCIYLSKQNEVLLDKLSLAFGISASSVIEKLISDEYWSNREKIEGLIALREKPDRYTGR